MSGKRSSGRSMLIYGISLALGLVGLAKITRAQSPDIAEDPAQSLAARSLQDQDQGKKDDKKDEKKDEKKLIAQKLADVHVLRFLRRTECTEPGRKACDP